MQCCLSAAVRAKSVHQAVHCTAPSDTAICSFGSSSSGAAVRRGRPRSRSSCLQSAAAGWAAICSLRSWEWLSGCRRCISAASSWMELSPSSERWQWSRMPRASNPASFSRVPAHRRDARLGRRSVFAQAQRSTQSKGECCCRHVSAASRGLPAAAGHTAGKRACNLHLKSSNMYSCD